MNVRPGGSLQLTMLGPPDDRRRIDWEGEYLEVQAPARLVFTIRSRPGTKDFEMVTVVLTELDGGRTEMLFEQRGSMSPEEYERATEGWGTFLDRLQERLASA